jgi:hypothetical protein
LSEDARGGPLFDAARVARLGDGAPSAGFAYSIRLVAKIADRRRERRRRTRLRSGKLLDLQNAFLGECHIYDQSDKGARVGLLADIPAHSVIQLYEDDPEQLRVARIVWRTNSHLGLCFDSRAHARRISRIQIICLRGSFYAVAD